MKTIWKYTLGVTDKQSLKIPTGFRVRHVAPAGSSSLQGVNVWVELDAKAPTVLVNFYITGTGNPIPEAGIYCGTAPVQDGLVWHVFVEATE